jgi:hypothetical protein
MTKIDREFLITCFEKLLDNKTLAVFEIRRVYEILNEYDS